MQLYEVLEEDPRIAARRNRVQSRRHRRDGADLPRRHLAVAPGEERLELLSQSELPVTFGVGRRDRVERVFVAWPSGRDRGVQECRHRPRLRLDGGQGMLEPPDCTRSQTFPVDPQPGALGCPHCASTAPAGSTLILDSATAGLSTPIEAAAAACATAHAFQLLTTVTRSARCPRTKAHEDIRSACARPSPTSTRLAMARSSSTTATLGQFVFTPPADASLSPLGPSSSGGSFVDSTAGPSAAGLRRTSGPSARSIGWAAGPMPAPKQDPRSRAMLTGRHDCDFVEINAASSSGPGVARTRRCTRSSPMSPGRDGVVRATFWDYTPGRSAALRRRPRPAARQRRDAVRLDRAAARRLAVRRTNQRHRRRRAGAGSVRVAGADPPQPGDHSADGEVTRRIRVRGVVTAYAPGLPVDVRDFTSTARFRFLRSVIYVNDGTGSARIEREETRAVAAGRSWMWRGSRPSYAHCGTPNSLSG